MPELPEVETIKLGLEKRIIGLKIQKIQILSPKSFIGTPKEVEGKIVLKIWRKGKLLGIELKLDTQDPSSLSPLVSLLFHLKMTGQLVWIGESEKGKGKRMIGGHPTEDMVGKLPNPHTRVIFTFNNGSKLYFNDQRRFGWIRVVDSVTLSEAKGIFQNLGPEPLEPGFTWQVLKKNLLRHKNMPVKVALMDQSVVSGIGNIYANEACFAAKIDPRTKVVGLTDKQFQALHRGVIRVIREAIKYGGSTRAHFVDAEGRKGYFLDYAYCYGLDKHKCKICGSEIKKIQLAGRGTYYCEKCQK